MGDDMFKKTIIVFCTLLCAPFVFAQVPDTETMYAIMDKAFFNNNFLEDFTCTLSLIIEKPNEPKEAAQFKLFRRDVKDQTCLVQIAPEADKGVGYLQEKNNLWAYDPISRSFTHSSLKRNLGNSDAKISDVNKKEKFKDSWEILKIEESKLGKFDVYAVTAKALDKDASYAQEKFFVR